MKNSYIINLDMQEDYKSFPVLWNKLPEELFNLPNSDMVIQDSFKIEDDGSLKSVSVAILEERDPDEFLSKEDYNIVSTKDVEFFVPIIEVKRIDSWDFDDLEDDDI